MLKNQIRAKISSMSKRKLLFIVGEHQRGKTFGVIEYLKEKFGDMWKNNYIDVGEYLQEMISEEQISIYQMFEQEFESDSVDIINELFDSNKEEFLVLDHCEWLFAEKHTEWLKRALNESEERRVIIVIVPEEYKSNVPLNAYSVIEWEGDNHED